MSNILRAIEKIVEAEGITITALESIIGASKGVLSRAIKNKTDIQSKWVEKIVENYPLYSSLWILTGKGDMYANLDSQSDTVSMLHEPVMKYGTFDNSIDNQTVPLYDLTATASVVEVFSNNSNTVPMDHIRIPNLPKCDGAIHVTGDSMYPILKSGDIVLYRDVHNKENIIWGEMYLLYINDENDEFFFCKYVQKSERKEYVRLVSQNQHHQPVEFHIDSVKHLAMVKASIRINSQI